MRASLYQNRKDHSKINTVEFFGLSRSGKTTYLKELIEKGRKGFPSERFSAWRKAVYFIGHLIKNFSKTVGLFSKLNKNWIKMDDLGGMDYIKIFWLRNKYLASVLGKYEILLGEKGETFVDEFLVQSVFMILQKKSSERKIREVLENLPKSNKILLIESDKKKRYERIKQTRFPAQQIHESYSKRFMKNSEHNYEIIKKILESRYGPAKKNPKF